jgi:2-polyprenyl-3-methyl-5-hydroxy-6-metoxy-1,4-benzoquinol methylase
MIKEVERSVEFEIIPCSVCGHESYRERFSFSDTLGHYAVVRCSECGLQFLNPRPTEDTIGVYYNSDNYTPFLSSASIENFFTKLYSFVREFSVSWKRKKVENMKNPGSVLDLGCGTGEFLFEMNQHGWNSFGLEPSLTASQFARDRLQLDVRTGTIGENALSQFDRTFDVITLWHVLEHVHHPNAALLQIRKILKDDGVLMIALPNADSYDALVYGKKWIALDVPRHLFHYTPETLTKLLAKSGFHIVRCHQMPLDAIFNCLMTEKAMVKNKILLPFQIVRMSIVMFLTLIMGMKRNRGSAVLYYVKKKL